MLKEIPKSDIITRPIKVYKEWTLDENDINPIFGEDGSNTLIDVDIDEKSHGFVKKIVQSIETITGFFGGWVISVDEERLFLTKSPDTNSSFIAIEHNASCYAGFGCWNSFICPKYDPYCCGPLAECVTGCYQCPQA